MMIKDFILPLFFMLNFLPAFSQYDELKKNPELYKSFMSFYEEKIKYSGNYEKEDGFALVYHQIDVIYQITHFDFNNDGQQDAIVGFSHGISDCPTCFFMVSALFENVNGKYRLVDFVFPSYTSFISYTNDIFYFEGYDDRRLPSRNELKLEYALENGKFVECNTE